MPIPADSRLFPGAALRSSGKPRFPAAEPRRAAVPFERSVTQSGKEEGG